MENMEKIKEKENITKDSIVKIAAKEMIKGSKMLGKQCEICNFPLFEDINGNIYCIMCNTKKEKTTTTSTNSKNNINNNTSNNKQNNNSANYTQDMDNLKNILNKKIDYLSKKLDKENEVHRIIEIATAIKLLLELKSKLNN